MSELDFDIVHESSTDTTYTFKITQQVIKSPIHAYIPTFEFIVINVQMQWRSDQSIAFLLAYNIV